MEIAFILVEPSSAGNVGSAARAMKTMGYDDLRLVNPGRYLNAEARKLAHGSTDILESASVYKDFESAAAGLDLLVATTAKKRSAARDYYSCEELPGIIERKGDAVRRIGIVFGKEESGLTNELIRCCDLVSTIPMKVSYPSLNLAQAVMIYAYILYTAGTRKHTLRKDEAVAEGIPPLKERVTKILDIVQISRNRTLTGRIMERIMAMGKDDINLAHTITQKLLENLRKGAA